MLFLLGNENIVRLLIETKADINVRDNNEKVAIHFAAQNGNDTYSTKRDNGSLPDSSV